VFWCDTEVVREDYAGRAFTLAFLRRQEKQAELPAPAPLPPAVGADALSLLLRPGEPVGGWDPRWEALTGLEAAEVDGAATELLLDWLFPVQHDRNRVGDLLALPAAESRGGWQAPLALAVPTGSRRLWCTFLPLGRSPVSPTWLLLVGGPASVGEPAAGSAVATVTLAPSDGDTLRADTPTEVAGPHARCDWPSALRPPGQGMDR
jgi:hypothetical protein